MPTPQSALPAWRRGAFAFARGAMLWPGMVAVAFIAANSLLFTSTISPDYREVIGYRWDLVSGLFALAVFLLAAWALARGWVQKINPTAARLLLAAYTIAFGLVWVMVVRSHPVDDALSVMTSAGEFLRGDYTSLAYNKYMGVYPFQLGLGLYEELWFRLAGEGNYLFLQVLNVAWVTLCYQLLVAITARLFRDENITRLAVLLLFLCLPPLFYSTFVYGTLPGLGCALAAVLLCLRYLQGGRWPCLAGSAALAALATVLKNNYLIFAIGIAVALAAHWLKAAGWRPLAAAAAVVVLAFCAHLPVRWLYQARSGQEIGAGMPRVLWVAAGLRPSERAPGWYSGVSIGLYEQNGYDAETAAEAGRQVVRTSLAEFGEDPGYAAEFFYQKTVSQWNEPTFSGLWVSHFDWPHQGALPGPVLSLYEGGLNILATGVMDAYHLLVYAFALAALWLRRKTLTEAQLLPLTILLGGFLFHMAWEGKNQYVLAYFVLMVPFAAAGLHDTAQKLNRRLGRHETGNTENAKEKEHEG